MLDLNMPTLIARIFVLVVAFTVHEFAHAWTAVYFGDETPRTQGRLTLNPLVHLDPIGSLLLLFSGFGWARPVQVNPWALNRRSPSAMMWVALAGPVSNLILAIIGSLVFRLSPIQPDFTVSGLLPSLGFLFAEFVWINLILLFFNLIPLAPLDGEKIAMYLFPPSWQDTLNRIRPYSPMILLAIVFLAPQVLGILVGKPASFVFHLLLL
ncbi:MAG: site-2 protease family protein [Anaerolineales bacterium]